MAGATWPEADAVRAIRTVTASSVSAVILSPHCDDACLSLGGALLAGSLGARPDVCIAFSVSCYTRSRLYRDEVARVTAVRRAEECDAAARAGYQARFWGLPEPFVRPGFSSFDDVRRSERTSRSDSTWAAVVEAVARLLSAHDGIVLLPMGCGDHIDHKILRDAALDYLEDIGRANYGFYEDLPYSAWFPEESCAVTVASVARQPMDARQLVTGQLVDKERLLSCYPSQLNEDDVADVRRHWRRVGGERVWLTTQGSAAFHGGRIVQPLTTRNGHGG